MCVNGLVQMAKSEECRKPSQICGKPYTARSSSWRSATARRSLVRLCRCRRRKCLNRQLNIQTQMRKVRFVLVAALFTGSAAPVLAQLGKPRAPLTNVRSACQELDASIPWAKNETALLYAELADRRKESRSPKETAEAIEAFEKHTVDKEVSWQRLGCAAIIYGK